jgi:hypothetical protein
VTGFDADRFDRLVAQNAPKEPEPFDASPEGALEGLLVHSFLLYDAPRRDADRACKKLLSAFVDLNELRVARIDEISSALGARYPKSEERADALKRTLNDLFDREHAVSLAPLVEKNKRDAKQYLASLAACPAYVSSRVLLLGFGGHAAPLDSLLHERLANAKVFDDTVDLERAASILERHVKAADALATHHAMESLRDAESKPSRPKPAKAGKRS